MTQLALIHDRVWTAEEIRKKVDAWPLQKQVLFWERVGLMDDAHYLDETVVRAWQTAIECGT